ncbi:hypothetical protein N7492_004414 [Penicillium capsulatum]|uniref:Uncharacterized protein n=1 Tax=Penicillium capsulatum TaxID=69766 RepID=A0A9W9LQQ1_9EURO|nr:hypothetical protein N7492_004414 [Penicillium capsulatum]KAJ6136465.1 hypothetical protein N7512_001625 [Penicillium capsulatum]
MQSSSTFPILGTPITLCGLPTTTLTWRNGIPTPIVWSCGPAAAATWSAQHSGLLDAGTCAVATLTVTMTAAPIETPPPATSIVSTQSPPWTPSTFTQPASSTYTVQPSSSTNLSPPAIVALTTTTVDSVYFSTSQVYIHYSTILFIRVLLVGRAMAVDIKRVHTATMDLV